jgi:hypothetical protein
MFLTPASIVLQNLNTARGGWAQPVNSVRLARLARLCKRKKLLRQTADGCGGLRVFIVSRPSRSCRRRPAACVGEGQDPVSDDVGLVARSKRECVCDVSAARPATHHHECCGIGGLACTCPPLRSSIGGGWGQRGHTLALQSGVSDCVHSGNECVRTNKSLLCQCRQRHTLVVWTEV